MSRQCLDMSTEYLDMSRHILGMAMVLSMAPLHSLGHNDQNDVKHYFFSHVMPLVPALLSCGAKCITSGIILFNR